MAITNFFTSADTQGALLANSTYLTPLLPPPGSTVPSEGDDTIVFYSLSAAALDTLGGNDTIYISGAGPFTVDAGTGNDDVRYSGWGPASIDAGDGYDKITISGSGVVTADAGAGHDKVFVNQMNDHQLDGGSGMDHLYFDGVDHASRFDLSASGTGTAVEFNGWNQPLGDDVVSFQNFEYLHGTRHDDKFIGSAQADRFYGNEGDDSLYGYYGNDFLRGDAGNDRLFGQNGNDGMIGNDGDDYMLGGAGNDRMFAGDGADRVYGGSGNDIIYSEAGWYEQDRGADVFVGGSGTDTLSYENAKGAVSINAELGIVGGLGAGHEVISTSPFTVTVVAQDTISGFEKYIGSDFDDTFRGKNIAGEFEIFVGGEGDDRMKASAGLDVFDGGTGDDTADYSQIAGHIQADLQAESVQAYGAEPGQMLWYDILQDVENLIGTDGQDQLLGDGADNLLEGGSGHDLLTGRAGNDTFAFRETGQIGHDQITDFEAGTDVILLEGLTLLAGNLAINGYDDLDGNGDGVINMFDAGVAFNGGDMRIDFVGGSLIIDNAANLHVEDFAFG